MRVKFSAVMISNEKSEILIVRRGETAPWMPLKWSLPGGTIEDGESPLDAACREVFEEVDIAVDPDSLQEMATVGPVKYYFCRSGSWSGTPRLKLTDGILENDIMSWESLDSVAGYDLLPGLLDVIRSRAALLESRRITRRLRALVRRQLTSLL